MATADITEEDWDRVVAINLRGVFLWSPMKHEIPLMLEHGGAIVNTPPRVPGSRASRVEPRTLPPNTAWSASASRPLSTTRGPTSV